ncbi:laccase 1 [Mycena epipterygia]|nr:laccase 1 [Mycena epipterygia]
MVFSALLSFCLISCISAARIGPTADIHLVNAEVSPDGFSRSAVLANGIHPGPLITANKGDEFNLNFIDDLIDDTMLRSSSIHWHGFFQKNNRWADGPAFVSQCPIAPNNSFLYTFPTGDQAGTFWYHSHYSTQYCDGLRGPLVVYDPEDPHRSLYDIDDDTTIITLTDWFHAPIESLGPIPPKGAEERSWRLPDSRYPGGPLSELAVVSVTAVKRYRFRLVSISCKVNFIFSIDGHNMTVIEADGINHQPLLVDSIPIFTGQRYSFILNANQPVDNYWMRSVSNFGLPGFNYGTNSAILRYVGAPIEEPSTNVTTSVIPLVENNLHPVPTEPGVPGLPIPGGADVTLNLQIVLNTTDKTYSVNGVRFIPPTTPVLLQILSGAQSAADLLPSGSVYALPAQQSYRGSLGAPHPFHLHGHAFHVIRSAGNSSYNFVNSPIRDVVSTGPDTTDNVTIRFVTDNAGPWFIHCHIDLISKRTGLAIVFAEDTGTVSKSKQPPAWNQLCPIYNALSPEQL